LLILPFLFIYASIVILLQQNVTEVVAVFEVFSRALDD